ncbi:hypothetical protein [Streptomyces sp. NPDC057302]|uniref:hypothetical protein n=1 Tax=Streptomyces sp. NPDC057302 TaxID=3346094 RepID=UPI00363F5D9D
MSYTPSPLSCAEGCGPRNTYRDSGTGFAFVCSGCGHIVTVADLVPDIREEVRPVDGVLYVVRIDV